MDERHDTIITGRTGDYRAPETFCRAIFLQLAARLAKRSQGRPSKELAKFLSAQAEAALNGNAGFDLLSAWPDGPDFGEPTRRQLLLDAFDEIVDSIAASEENPEDWNACSRWREWGIVKAREWQAFLRAEAANASTQCQ